MTPANSRFLDSAVPFGFAQGPLKELSAHSWVAPYNVAVIYAGLGEKDKAFALLERAYQDRSYYMPSFLTMDERLDNLHSDPRFADLRKRVGLPQ